MALSEEEIASMVNSIPEQVRAVRAAFGRDILDFLFSFTLFTWLRGTDCFCFFFVPYGGRFSGWVFSSLWAQVQVQV